MNAAVNPYRPANADPRSVYVHIPFCRHRCGYCNFALVAGRDHLIDNFLDALETEINLVAGSFEIDTLFFGGGTPSHLSESQINRLGEVIYSKFSLSDDAEVSAECNPSDISNRVLTALTSIGVNRISLGVQSFNNEKLKTLQRDHNGIEAKTAFELAFERTGNVSMDLIFATPNESQSQWDQDLKAAIELGPSHLSTYELTWEKGTTFWNRLSHGELDGSSEDLCVSMYEASIECCNAIGLRQYEISSFAVEGKRCRHNLQYWLCNPWFAFGPSAASFVNGIRRTNHRSPTTWMKRILNGESAIGEVEELSVHDRAIERLIFGLRMVEGIDVPMFESACGTTIDSLVGAKLPELLQRELVSIDSGTFRLTEQGVMLADSVAAELL